MKNKKKFNTWEALISITIVLGICFIINRYDEINDFYIQKKENYADLKKLNNEILKNYHIDLTDNEKLSELKRRVEYDEHMISGLEPNTEIAQYYWWILMGMSWVFILAKWIEKNATHLKIKLSNKLCFFKI